MISVKLTKDATQKTASGYLWQWDYGQQLQVSGIDFPTVTEVHFATANDTKAVETVGTVTDGVLTVDIPDGCLTEVSHADYFVKAYIYVVDADAESGTTTYQINIPVKHRAKGVYVTPVRTEPDAFDQMIAAVETIAEKAQTSADSAAEAATAAVKEATADMQEDIDSNTAARHTHDNKAVLDGITADKIAQWDESFDGDYNSLINKPTIPAALSDLTDDETHRTVTDAEKTAWSEKSDFSGSYNDLTNKPTIPTVPTYGTGLTLSDGILAVDDTHINSLIKSQLEEVENGTY